MDDIKWYNLQGPNYPIHFLLPRNRTVFPDKLPTANIRHKSSREKHWKCSSNVFLHRSNLSNQILPEEKRIKLQQIWIKLRHNYFWVEKAKNSILRQNPIKVGRITQKKTFLTNKMSMYKTVKTNDKICFMKNKDVCLMCPESVSGNNSPWAISSNTLPRDQEIYCILDNMVSCPYTAERRDVLGNTSVEDQEISRGWGFCTLGTCNS